MGTAYQAWTSKSLSTTYYRPSGAFLLRLSSPVGMVALTYGILRWVAGRRSFNANTISVQVFPNCFPISATTNSPK